MAKEHKKIFEIKNFKYHKPAEEDISDYDLLIYQPQTFLSHPKKPIEPALTEKELYEHMSKDWDFSKEEDLNYYQTDCINFLIDTDFQTFLNYGKSCNKNYKHAKDAYLFDAFFRNFLQEILENIEVYIKKMTSDSLLLGYTESEYIFSNDTIYFEEIPQGKADSQLSNNEKKYTKYNSKRVDRVEKTKYYIYGLIESKKSEKEVAKQIEEHGVALPWTVFRMMTFGNISNFLTVLKPEKRNQLADHISNINQNTEDIPSKLLLSWVNALRYLRNLCSHGDRLFRRLHNTLPAIHNADHKKIDDIKKLVSQENKDHANAVTFVYFFAMKRIIEHMSKDSIKFWNSKMKDLAKMWEKEEHILPDDYGFPTNWLDILTIE